MMTTLRVSMCLVRSLAGLENGRIQRKSCHQTAACTARLDVLVEDAFEVFLRRETDDRLDHLTALEEQHGGDTTNLKLHRGVRVVVDVQLPDRDLAGIIGCQRVDRWTQPLTGPAPLRPEIDKHRFSGIQYRGLKVGIGKSLYVFGCH